jgi:hypothetical protein
MKIKLPGTQVNISQPVDFNAVITRKGENLSWLYVIIVFFYT